MFSSHLDRLMAFCNPITIDLLGHGDTKTEPNPKRFEAEEQTEDLFSVLDRLQFSSLFMHGYSMGGRLAVQFAIKYPKMISGLILESTHCGIETPELRRDRVQKDEERALALESHQDNFLKEWRNLPLFGSDKQSDNEPYNKIMENQDSALMAASLRGFGAGTMPSVWEEFSNLELPVGLIAGKNDEKYVDKMSKMAQLCPESTFEIIDDAGHRVHSDQPEKWVQFLNRFIQKYHV